MCLRGLVSYIDECVKVILIIDIYLFHHHSCKMSSKRFTIIIIHYYGGLMVTMATLYRFTRKEKNQISNTNKQKSTLKTCTAANRSQAGAFIGIHHSYQCIVKL